MAERENKKKRREGIRSDLRERRAERRVRRRMLSSEADSEPRVTLVKRLGWTTREAWWSFQERLLWPIADWARVGADAIRWPFEHVAWAVRERLLWPFQDRLAERPSGTARVPKAATVSVIAILAAGSLGAGVLVASGGDGTNSSGPSADATVVAQAGPETASDPVTPILARTEPRPESPSLKGPRPSFGAGSDAERKEARAALRKLKDAGEGNSAQAEKDPAGQAEDGPETPVQEDTAPAQEDTNAATEDSGQQEETPSAESQTGGDGEEAATDPVTGATASATDSRKKARRKESPLSVAERFAMAFVSYEVGASGKATDATFKDSADKDLYKSLKERPPRQPSGGKVPRARVVNVVGGPRKKESMEISIGLLRVDGISELRLDMARLGRGWVVKTVRG